MAQNEEERCLAHMFHATTLKSDVEHAVVRKGVRVGGGDAMVPAQPPRRVRGFNPLGEFNAVVNKQL